MKAVIKHWIAKLGKISNRELHSSVNSQLNDLRALALLPDLQVGYLPWSSFAIRPSALAMILNEVVINRRRTIIECGIGISTLYLLSSQLGNTTRLVGIDEDADWIALITGYLEKMGVPPERYRFVHAPVISYSDGDKHAKWYDFGQIEAAIDSFVGNSNADMLLVDGPKGSHSSLARYLALPKLHRYLKEDFTIFLDDIDRHDEYAIGQLWKEEFGLQAQYYAEMGKTAVLKPNNTKSIGTTTL